MAYEFLEHTADLKIRATGKTLPEALSESAKALFEAIASNSKIAPTLERELTIKVNKPEILVHDFLSQLIYLFSTEHLLFSEFNLDLKESIGYKLTAKLKGEKYDPKKHKLVKEVKAATYHEMKVEEGKNGWTIEVICDT
ncbi:MAG: archease [Candidatus Altiarchaeota archaeon]